MKMMMKIVIIECVFDSMERNIRKYEKLNEGL